MLSVRQDGGIVRVVRQDGGVVPVVCKTGWWYSACCLSDRMVV